MAWTKASTPETKKQIKRPGGFSNMPLFFLGILLTAFGLLMIYSSSAVMGLQKYGDAFYYVKKQGLFLLIGWALYFVVAQIPVVRFAKMRTTFLLLGFALLAAVFIPGIGASAGGAQRWLNFIAFRFQPSELVRLLIVFYIAATLVIRAERLQSFNKGFLPLLIVTGSLMLMLLLQPDFGGAMSILLLSVALWFIGGVPMSYLAGLAILTLPAMVFVVVRASYRLKRVLTFMDPYADAQGSGFQVIQSYLAFLNGGWTGVGIGNSQQKLFYLPEAHTDFIFSVLGEELGVIGISLVIILFLLLLYYGVKITRSQVSTFGYYLGCGLTLFLVLPALLNMMVTFGMLPTKGLPLPFFSSGGSSLLASLLALGILQSLSARSHEDPRPV